MASDNSRDVALNVGVKTTGAEDIARLGDDLRGIGDNARAASPEIDKLASELDRLTAEKEQRQATERDARTEAAAQRKTLDEQREALARLRLTTDDAGKAEAAYAERVRAAQIAILDSRAALRAKQEAVTASANATKQAAAAESSVRAELERSVAAYRAQGQAAAAAATQTRTAGDAVADLGAKLRAVQSAALALAGGSILGGLAGDVARTADEFKGLEARVRLATDGAGSFDEAMTGVQSIAQRTGTALETTADLFAKVSTNTKQLGLSTADTLNIVESVTQAIALSGSTAAASSGSLTQFAQALASGTLRGDELNSVLEGSPRLARALADGLGVTTGALREMGAAGALTSAQVIGALQGQSDVLRREFETLPATIGRSITNLSSAWTTYIGEADKASGASATAAAAVDLLASNLDTVAGVLFSAGKAAAAYQALKLAQEFIGIGTAAKVATAEMTALSAAQATAATTGAAAAGSVGRLAGLLSTLKTFSLVGVLTNLPEIGAGIANLAARVTGLKGEIEGYEQAALDAAEADRRAAAERARYAQESRLAEEATFGLNTRSRELIGTFDEAIKKGDGVADALGKVSKAFDTTSIDGITAAGVALDRLASTGKASATAIRDAWQTALKDIDLGTFEATARAAFDGSAEGARRLQAALDAVAEESLRRVGTSTRELESGFSAATASAINDVDTLARRLDELGVEGDRAGALLGRSLSTALQSAGTEQAIQAIIDRLNALGAAGQINGQALAQGLDVARAKLDAIRDGVNSIDEALRTFGLQTKAQLQATADTMGAAWQRISADTTVSIGDMRNAFDQYAAATTAANGGIEPSFITLQRRMLETREAAAGMGRGMTDAFDGARRSADALTASVQQAASASASLDARNDSNLSVFEGDKRAAKLAGQGGPVDASLVFNLLDKIKNGSISGADLPDLQNALQVQKNNAAISTPQNTTFEALRQGETFIKILTTAIEGLTGSINGSSGLPTIGSRSSGSGSVATSAPAPAPAARTVNINIGGRTTPIGVSSQNDSDNLVSVLRALESSQRVSAGGS